MRRGLIRSQCNFPIQRLDAIKEEKRRKENVLAPLDGSKTLHFHTYAYTRAASWGNIGYTDMSHLDFSERFHVTYNTYEHFNDIFRELPRNVSAEVSYRIDALKFHERNEFILAKIFFINISNDEHIFNISHYN